MMQKLQAAFLALFLISARAYQQHRLSYNVNCKAKHKVPPLTTIHLATSPSQRLAGDNCCFIFATRMSGSDTDISCTQASQTQNSLLRMIVYSIGASTSILVAGTFFVVLATQRDALMVSFFLGAITNGALSKILKRILNQDRPIDKSAAVIATTSSLTRNSNTFVSPEQPSDKGMPSSHAMSLGFIGTFTMLTLGWTIKLAIPFYVATSLFYRVQTRLHTVEQVVVGLVVGVTNGYIWRHLVDGNNPLGINIMEFCSRTFLDDQGLLPIPFLIIPVLMGAVVVGSLERKISKFFKSKDS